MEIHLPEPEGLHLPLRARLLGGALVAHLRASGHTLLPAAPRQTGVAAVQESLTLAALPPHPAAPRVASLGLGLPAALARGRATLLLTQSLTAELAAFGGAEAWARAGTLPLLLQGYARALLVDRADVAGSVGFAPWIPLLLADRFPVQAPLPAPEDPRAPPRILVLDHGAPPGQAEVLRRALRDLEVPLRVIHGTSDHAEMGAGLVADLHIHLGYGPDRAVVAFSPFDSLLSGAYTLVLPDAERGAGAALRTLCAGRSYGDLAPGLSDLATRARAMVTRLQAIRAAGDGQNPELMRFAAQNAAARAADLKRFDAVLDAPSEPRATWQAA